MKLLNAIKKLEKAGASVEKNGIFYSAKINNDVIEFMCKTDSIACIKVRSANDHDDIMTDYSAGVWCNNLSQAIRIAA